jgi:hypothetical protein
LFSKHKRPCWQPERFLSPSFLTDSAFQVFCSAGDGIVDGGRIPDLRFAARANGKEKGLPAPWQMPLM